MENKHAQGNTMATLREVFKERLEEFQESYTFSEHDEVVRSLAVTGEILDLAFGPTEASTAMTALREIISGASGARWDWARLNDAQADPDWRKSWQEIDGYDATVKTSTADSAEGLAAFAKYGTPALESPSFLEDLHNLNAFANYGILPIWSLADRLFSDLPDIDVMLEEFRDVPSWAEAICLKIDRLERLSPRNEAGATSLDETLITRNRARARIKFDLGQAITIHDLASLSGVSAKRVQNAVYAKTDEAPIVDRNGLISPDACEPWLTARDYHRSIWKQVVAHYPLNADWGQDIEYEETEPTKLVEDYEFVPVANDGSLFTPSLRREGKSHEGGYTIGAKGTERVIASFDEALAELRKMETPRWRRPNPESGNWGIVTGQTWKRVRRSELADITQ